MDFEELGAGVTGLEESPSAGDIVNSCPWGVSLELGVGVIDLGDGSWTAGDLVDELVTTCGSLLEGLGAGTESRTDPGFVNVPVSSRSCRLSGACIMQVCTAAYRQFPSIGTSNITMGCLSNATRQPPDLCSSAASRGATVLQ